MRRGVLIALLAVSLGVPSVEAGEAGPENRCRVSLEKAPAAHALSFSAVCDYEMTRIKVEPSQELRNVRRGTSLSGRVDPEDRFSCSRNDGGVACRGRAGEGARVSGVLRIRGPACETSAGFTTRGNIDCDSGVCALPEFISASHVRRPKGC
jgi:hypothetical protein